MRFFLTVLFSVSAVFSVLPLHAVSGETFYDALASAYTSNPVLRAARAELRRTDEGVPEALAGWRPEADVIVGSGYVYTRQDGGENSTLSQSNGVAAVLRLRVRQPLYNFSTGSLVDQAENAVKAQRAHLRSVEQNTLLEAARAYLELIRAQAMQTYSQEFRSSMDAALSSTERQLAKGLVGSSAVAEARSQQQIAASEVINAEASVAVAKEHYREVIGSLPDHLTMPDVPLEIPETQREIIDLAENYPPLLAALYSERAAREAIDAAEGRKLPSFYLEGQADARNAAVLGLMSVPLYNGLSNPRIRAAKQDAIKARYDVEAQRREAQVAAVRAWQDFQRAQAQITTSLARLDTAVASADAVRREQNLGLKTPSDLFRNDLNVLKAKTDLIGAQRDVRIAALEALAVTGHLTAKHLQLPVPYYDENKYYDSVRDSWFGDGEDIDKVE
ncbi:MAG: TolC family protein [Hyphomicrobiales bacterium]|nr:TolC family protein [Hyphomicrobiales bacterium]